MGKLMELDELELVEMLSPAARSGTSQSGAVDIRDYEGVVSVTLHAAAASSTATLDITLEDSADGSTDWQELTDVTFPQITNADGVLAARAVDTRKVRRYLRAVYTHGGSGSVVVGVVLQGWVRQ